MYSVSQMWSQNHEVYDSNSNNSSNNLHFMSKLWQATVSFGNTEPWLTFIWSSLKCRNWKKNQISIWNTEQSEDTKCNQHVTLYCYSIVWYCCDSIHDHLYLITCYLKYLNDFFFFKTDLYHLTECRLQGTFNIFKYAWKSPVCVYRARVRMWLAPSI